MGRSPAVLNLEHTRAGVLSQNELCDSILALLQLEYLLRFDFLHVIRYTVLSISATQILIRGFR
jgi:hypothetical protein